MAIELARVEEFALITLNRPDALNALSFALIRDLGTALDEVAQGDARALLITGAGPKAFCAGADIKELTGRTLAAQRQGAELGQAVFARLDRMPMASVAIINGYAFGGGLELALAFTIRIAADTLKCGLPEIKLGVFPGLGGTQRLPRIVGEGRALEIILTGRTIDAQEALAIGLVTRVVPEGELRAEALALAQRLADGPPIATRIVIEAVRRASDMGRAEGLDYERRLFGVVCATEDKQEGIAAWLEKRTPTFGGR